MTGILHVVATPIGNPGDCSARAREVLGGVGRIAAEDTRTTAQLLGELGLPAVPLTALHDHNEAERVPGLVQALLDGESVALVSDAGTPLISDPGYRLIAAAHEAGIRVSPVPGPCAALAALSVAGLASDRFQFEGFLPARQGPRQARLADLADVPHTLIFHEAPHRILETLEDLCRIFGETRLATLARELTKTWETVRRDSLGGLRDWVAADCNQQRGEIVLLVSGAPARDVGDVRPLAAADVLSLLVRELPLKQAAAITAELFGLRKNALYDLAMQLRDGGDSA